MRPTLILLLSLLVAACATPKPPSKKPGASSASSSRPPSQTSGAASRSRWQAVPAKADGAVVPGGRRHIIKRGETGVAIASAYNVSWSRIAAANNLDREATLFVGQSLFIPTASGRPAAGSTAGAQASTQPRNPSGNRGAPSRPRKPQTPEEHAAAFTLDIDDLITGSAPAQTAAAPTPAKPAIGPSTSPTQTRPQAPAQTATTQTANVPKLGWPTDGRVILSRFGPKSGGRVNDGINIKTLRGSPVRAAADGEVLYVGDAIAGYGLMMLLRHPGGIITAYGHLEDALADRGTKVQRGQTIARAGSSGTAASEPQLLFQLRHGRRALDPLIYLPR